MGSGLIVVGGPSGSGKTLITQQLLMQAWMGGCVYAIPDFIARDEFGDWNSPLALIQAAQRATEIREHCLEHGRSLDFEAVRSAPDKLDFIRRARCRFLHPDVLRRYRRPLDSVDRARAWLRFPVAKGVW